MVVTQRRGWKGMGLNVPLGRVCRVYTSNTLACARTSSVLCGPVSRAKQQCSTPVGGCKGL